MWNWYSLEVWDQEQTTPRCKSAKDCRLISTPRKHHKPVMSRQDRGIPLPQRSTGLLSSRCLPVSCRCCLIGRLDICVSGRIHTSCSVVIVFVLFVFPPQRIVSAHSLTEDDIEWEDPPSLTLLHRSTSIATLRNASAPPPSGQHPSLHQGVLKGKMCGFFFNYYFSWWSLFCTFITRFGVFSHLIL